MQPDFQNIKQLLDDRTNRYNNFNFIETDPIQIPHRFSRKEDIEIAAFLTATIAWGQRKSIINNASRLMELMDNSPYEFLMDSMFNIRSATLSYPSNNEKFESSDEYARLKSFVHRTFNGNDCLFFLASLRNIYRNHGGLEKVFTDGYLAYGTVFGALNHFRNTFLSIPYEKRVAKHVSDVSANSSAKRLNMYLRWMVRGDEHEVDFGLWKNIPMSALMLPLDVHTGDVARALNLLQRRQNDWKAVTEITDVLRSFDPEDPVKYDFALFGIGAFEGKNHQFPII
jgi:uncharacterized protein (TIGR02757 family)